MFPRLSVADGTQRWQRDRQVASPHQRAYFVEESGLEHLCKTPRNSFVHERPRRLDREFDQPAAQRVCNAAALLPCPEIRNPLSRALIYLERAQQPLWIARMNAGRGDRIDARQFFVQHRKSFIARTLRELAAYFGRRLRYVRESFFERFEIQHRAADEQ